MTTSTLNISATTANPTNLKADNLIQKHPLWRALEIVPGAISWSILIMPLTLSFFAPRFVITFIILYTIIWLFRSIKLAINLYRSYRLSKQALDQNWTKLITLNDYPEKIDYELKKIKKEQQPKKYFQLLHLKNQIQKLKVANQWKKSKHIYHAILYVTYKESYELIRESMRSYANSDYPSSKMIIVLAGEEADQENFKAIAKKIKTEFGTQFGHFITTVHPKNIPGEIKGKSANATYAAKQLKKYLDQKNIAYDNVMVSNFDADTIAHPNYFAELTFKYLTSFDRTEKAYQPNSFLQNNIWDVPTMIRMVAQCYTFWRMAESVEKTRYKSFSSRSLSFQTTLETNYWDPSVIPEDSRQYWTAFAIYNGRHTLVPILSPVYMDAVLSETYLKTFKSQYVQLRRWAWGVCDFPFMVLNLWYNPTIKLSAKLYHIYDFLCTSLFWATGPIIITFMGFIPSLLNPSFRETVLAYNGPQVMSNILTIATAGLIVLTIISSIMLPRRPKSHLLGHIVLTVQWILIPIVSIFLGAIPALDAQTRLILGRRLEYQVTQKARK